MKRNTDYIGKLDQLPLPEVLWPHQPEGELGVARNLEMDLINRPFLSLPMPMDRL